MYVPITFDFKNVFFPAQLNDAPFFFLPSLQLRKNTTKSSRPPVTFNPNLETDNNQQNSTNKEKSASKLSRLFGLRRSKSSSDDGADGGDGAAGAPSSTMMPGRSSMAPRSAPLRQRHPREAGLVNQSQIIDPNQVR